MKSPLTTSFAGPVPAAPARPETVRPPELSWREAAPVVSALLMTLEAIETGPKAGPAMRAHRAALRRQGEAAEALGGAEAMEVVLRQVADADAARAERRLAFVRDAWSGLTGRR